MKLSQTLNDALNQQVLKEYGNMLFYKQVESFFEDLQLKNIAGYFGSQAQHEKDHGDKFIQYINDRVGGKVQLGEVNAPILSVDNYKEIGRVYLLKEEETTRSIEELYDLAVTENSFIDLSFLLEMLREQVEEEDSAQEFMMKVNMVTDIVLFDAEFGG